VSMIEKRTTRSGPRYEMRLRGPDGKERSRTFRTREEAERYERAAQRPTASVAEVAALVDNMPDRMRLAVLLAAWCQLRRAEIVGRERQDLDLLHGRLQVRRVANRVKGALVIGPPKTEVGIRTIAIPPHLLPEVRRHLGTYVA